jgi:chromosome segregation ATPase
MQSKSTRGVQQQEVSLAADALLAEQLKPTIERVRMKLGRGSPNTVGPMLDAWFSTLGGRLGVSTYSEQDGAPPAALQLAMHEMWKTALSEAKASLETTQASFLANLGEQTKQLNLELANVHAERASFIEKENLLNEALQQSKLQFQSTTSQINQLQKLLESKDAELQQGNAALKELAAELSIERKNCDERTNQHHTELRALSTRFETTERRLLTEIDRERQISKKIRSQLETSHDNFDATKAQLLDAARQIGKKLQESEVANAALSERLAANQLRLNELKEQQQTSAATKKRAAASKIKKSQSTT